MPPRAGPCRPRSRRSCRRIAGRRRGFPRRPPGGGSRRASRPPRPSSGRRSASRPTTSSRHSIAWRSCPSQARQSSLVEPGLGILGRLGGQAAEGLRGVGEVGGLTVAEYAIPAAPLGLAGRLAKAIDLAGRQRQVRRRLRASRAPVVPQPTRDRAAVPAARCPRPREDVETSDGSSPRGPVPGTRLVLKWQT